MKAKINLTNCPLLQNKYYHSDSVFTVDSLLENARQQKKFCTNDYTKSVYPGSGRRSTGLPEKERQAFFKPKLACYNTTLYNFSYRKWALGLITNLVGASFATPFRAPCQKKIFPL